MERRYQLMFIILLSLFFVVMLSRPAYAYIDPGTGSFFLQLLIGAILGVLFAVKLFWQRIYVFFSGLFSKKQKDKEGHDEK